MHSQGLGLIVPGWRVVDIDTEDDWYRAELMFQVMKVENAASIIFSAKQNSYTLE